MQLLPWSKCVLVDFEYVTVHKALCVFFNITCVRHVKRLDKCEWYANTATVPMLFYMAFTFGIIFYIFRYWVRRCDEANGTLHSRLSIDLGSLFTKRMGALLQDLVKCWSREIRIRLFQSLWKLAGRNACQFTKWYNNCTIESHDF